MSKIIAFVALFVSTSVFAATIPEQTLIESVIALKGTVTTEAQMKSALESAIHTYTETYLSQGLDPANAEANFVATVREMHLTTSKTQAVLERSMTAELADARALSVAVNTGASTELVSSLRTRYASDLTEQFKELRSNSGAKYDATGCDMAHVLLWGGAASTVASIVLGMTTGQSSTGLLLTWEGWTVDMFAGSVGAMGAAAVVAMEFDCTDF